MNIQNISSGLNQAERFPWINSYLINGSAIIDPGMGYDISRNINLEHVEKVFLTFAHPEHFGVLEEVDFGDVTVYVRDREELDMDADYRIEEISDGDNVEMGGQEFEVLERRGLMPSLGFYNEEEQFLFSGHLFIENREMIDAVATWHGYLRLLEDVQELDIETVHPPHGESRDAGFIEKELSSIRSMDPERFAFSEGMLEANSMARAYEHEWNRGFDNPYREYLPNEKWMFYTVDPDHGVLKSIFGGLMMYLAAAYLYLIIWLRSEDYLEQKYLK